jgi:hypothetical protein
MSGHTSSDEAVDNIVQFRMQVRTTAATQATQQPTTTTRNETDRQKFERNVSK